MSARSKKKREGNWGYDVNDIFDRAQIMDLPFDMLNAKGRKAKKHYNKINK
jgi:hypothetical protein